MYKHPKLVTDLTEYNERGSMDHNRYIANTRMYDVCPQVAALWRELVEIVSRCSGVPVQHVPHAWPANIEDLWRRPDLGLTFICGRPFRLFGAVHQPVAVPVLSDAPIVSPTEIPSGSLYATHFLVHAESPWTSLEDSFGSRLGWTVMHSHSGYNALRRALLPHYRGIPLYRAFIGPLHTPGRCLEALARHEADVVPMDSYCYTLLLRHAPERLSGCRLLASSPPAPMPFLAASPETPETVCVRLREALLSLDNANLLEGLALKGFAPVQADDYHLLDRWDEQANTAGLNWHE